MISREIHLVNPADLVEPFILKSDLASEFPIYLYLPDDKRQLFFSSSIHKILKKMAIDNSLFPFNQGISFLLQSGVIPPPKTIFKNLFVLGVGDVAEVNAVDGNLTLSFKHNFPFLNSARLKEVAAPPDDNHILEILAEATTSRIEPDKPTFLFHSAGKDSNSIALALAEAGWQDRVTLITHRSKGAEDESEISKKIAKKLGFKHRILREIDSLNANYYEEIQKYFLKMPFPSVDSVTLAYPTYMLQLPELKGSNIIDGGGNDTYMGTPPTKKEQLKFIVSHVLSRTSFLRSVIHSENPTSQILKTSAEWCGMDGFSFADSKKIYKEAESVYRYWQTESKIRLGWDLFDFKTDILTCVTAAETHIRKVRNFSDSISANLILPWANEKVASYMSLLPEQYLFNRKNRKNKIIIRTMLYERLGLNCDLIGKMGYSYDFKSVVLNNWMWTENKIINCCFWSVPEIKELLKRLETVARSSKYSRRSNMAAKLIYRLLMIALWSKGYEYGTRYQ